MNWLTDGAKEISDRATSKLPKFWKRVRNGFGAVGLTALVLSKMPFIGEEWKLILREVGQYLVTIAGTAQFTKV